MNINQLRYFISVAEFQSFTKAANQYYISQTAVTQQIQSLEEQLGVVLFDRTKRPIALTSAGQIFLHEAQSILDKMNHAMQKMQDATAGLSGTLHVGYTKGYERSNLSKLLREFHQDYPNVLFTCHRCDTEALAGGLLNNDFDIIFTWDSTNLLEDEGISHKVMQSVPLSVALYDTHPLAHRNSLSREDLKNEPILYMSPSATGESLGDNHFMELYRQAGYQPNIVFRSSDTESILLMVAAEEGVSIMPSYMSNTLTDAENLVFLPLLGSGEVEEIVAAWKTDVQNPALKHFIQMI